MPFITKSYDAYPGDVPALRERAMEYLRLGQYQNSIQDYNQVLRLDPNGPLMEQRDQKSRTLARSRLLEQAKVRYQQGDDKGAIADAASLIRLCPDDREISAEADRLRSKASQRLDNL